MKSIQESVNYSDVQYWKEIRFPNSQRRFNISECTDTCVPRCLEWHTCVRVCVCGRGDYRRCARTCAFIGTNSRARARAPRRRPIIRIISTPSRHPVIATYTLVHTRADARSRGPVCTRSGATSSFPWASTSLNVDSSSDARGKFPFPRGI